MPDYTFTPLTLVIIASTIMALLLAFVSWQRRQTPGVIWFAFLMLAFSGEYAFYALEIASPTVQDQHLWAKVQYLSIPLQGLLTLLAYQGFARIGVIRRRTIMALLIIPLITIVVAWTNEYHQLLWQNYRLVPSGPVVIFTFETGPWYLVNLVYSYALVIIGISLLVVQHATTEERIYRNQLRILILSSVVLTVLTISHVFNLVPYGLEAGPFAFLPMSLVLIWGLFYYQLWDSNTLQDRLVLQNMQDGIIILDTQQRIVDLNPAASSLFSLARVGQVVQDVLPAHWLVDFDPQTELLTEVTRQNNQATAFYEVRTLPLYGHLDNFEGTLLMVREITRRKQAELEREQTIAELGAFAHTVAHDLKSPLTVIVGNASTLADDPTMPPTESQHAISTMNATSQLMSEIIDELLLLASLNQQNPTLTVVDMDKVIQNTEKRLRPILTSQQAQINTQQQWPELISYAPWVEEALTKLVSNAVMFGGQPPCVTIGADQQPDGRIRLWVRDNGQGLTAEEQAQLFARTSRLAQHTATTGLGLSIVQRIAARLGGEPVVESTPGQGCTFSLVLPGQSEPVIEA